MVCLYKQNSDKSLGVFLRALLLWVPAIIKLEGGFGAQKVREVVTMAVDWLRIKTEYINGDISYRDLAKKWGVPFPTLRDRAARESWKEAKEQQRNKVVTETSQKTVNKMYKGFFKLCL